jgi:hypothetical protein
MKVRGGEFSTGIDMFLAELSQLGTSEPVKCFGIRRGQ